MIINSIAKKRGGEGKGGEGKGGRGREGEEGGGRGGEGQERHGKGGNGESQSFSNHGECLLRRGNPEKGKGTKM